MYETAVTKYGSKLPFFFYSVASAGTVGHESEIMCEGLSGIRNSTILHPVGEPVIIL